MALHLAWHSQKKKRFAVLSGLSGTGKTALLKNYASVYCDEMGLDRKRHIGLVPVSPDWRDPAGLLGYLNALHADPTFQAEPALKLVLDAARNPNLPFFLILDEMNLARVERYFAPFLSAMETGESLALHTNMQDVNGIPPTIPWPGNLFIGGTVNMDETTYPFSDKVLDRAFTLEFWEVNLKAFFDKRTADSNGIRLVEIESILLEMNQVLAQIRRHFGYRVADEILSFLEAANGSTTDKGLLISLVDQAIFSKVLPRLRGHQTQTLESAFKQLMAVCKKNSLSQCESKINEMLQTLSTSGVARFWS